MKETKKKIKSKKRLKRFYLVTRNSQPSPHGSKKLAVDLEEKKVPEKG